MALSSTSIVKVIIVTDNLEKTVSAYRTLLGTGTAPAEAEARNIRKPYTRYMSKEDPDLSMKVESVFTDNFWFEIIQPTSSDGPWADWLKHHGTSCYSICLVTNGSLEEDEKKMKEIGFESIFKQEKGFEAYEYFDTAKTMGVLMELKEHY